MFHVKHSFRPYLKRGLKKIIPLIKTTHSVSFGIDSPSLLPFVLSSFDCKKLVVCKEGSFDDVLGSFGLFSSDVVGFPYIDVFDRGATVIKSYHQDLFDRASVRLSSDLKSITTCVVDERALGSLAVFRSSDSSLLVGSEGVSQEALLAFLRKNKYVLVEQVFSPGEYVVRGGVVDVFSFGLLYPFRCGFLGNKKNILFFNPSSGAVIKKTLSCFVFPFPKNKTISIKDACSSFYRFYLGSGRLIIINPCIKNKISQNFGGLFSAFSYTKYRESSSSFSVVFCDLLLSEGCLFSDVLFLPSWFSKTFFPLNLGSIPLSGTLVVGDYYVHESFGVCKYLGFVPGDKKNEKISLKFSDGKMSLDVRYLGRISFFSKKSTKTTSLGSLNKPGVWRRKKEASYKKALGFVGSLVRSYAKRKQQKAPVFIFDKELVALFVSGFKYVDTPGQALAWKSVVRDLCSSRPMNRLLCGDVGFGKTEVAMRAVFLACINKKRSIVLAPTTVLSQQLFDCFFERMSPFGIRVLQVSRLTKKSANNLALFVSRKADVLVGTHAVIKSGAVLHNVSLFVVDDEHRFGVDDKERVFKFSPGCHYLSMSATPIPRTLQLSLSGIRNISPVLSPPQLRKPIITNIYFYNKLLISRLVLNELQRGGQVYVVDNSVNTVRHLSAFFSRLFPLFVVSSLFGSMVGDKIKKTMSLFRSGKIHVLVSTVIIESGIDVPLANTIIINNAHLFGLSQLHQLRGRVGRSGVQSYACLMVPKRATISSDAMDRLHSIKRYSALGSGYKIAIKDLQIRGAGNLFGYNQSGQGSVGFEYYTKLLSLALKNINTKAPPFSSADVVLGEPFIPASFVPDDSERAFYYKSIFECFSVSELDILKKKTVDLFGSLPFSFLLLFITRRLSLFCEKTPVVSVIRSGVSFVVVCSKIKLKNLDSFLVSIDSFFKHHKIKYTFVSNGSFLKIQFSYVAEDYYILLESFIKKLYV